MAFVDPTPSALRIVGRPFSAADDDDPSPSESTILSKKSDVVFHISDIVHASSVCASPSVRSTMRQP
jgi:hypothetical protein